MSKNKTPDRIYTGSTLLDLVVGGGQGMGWPLGKVINIVGDKSSGKTFLACEIIAANYHRYKKALKYNYDDGESGFTFDTNHLYGFEVLTPDTLRSHLVEEFDVNTRRFLKEVNVNELGIYILDSLDGLSNEEIEGRSDKRFKAAESGKKFDDGTYGVKTPKFLSQEFFRTKTREFHERNTNLIIVSQVRQNIDPFTSKFTKYTRSGGKALDFFAHTALWLATVRKLKKKDRTYGVVIKARADKSKTPRPFRECMLTIYFDYGIDNIGSNLDYLFDLRGADGKLKDAAKSIYWSGKPVNLPNLKAFLESRKILDNARQAKKKDTGKPQLTITWVTDWITDVEKLRPEFEKEFGKPESRAELIERIEADPKMEKELEQRVIEKWEGIEQSIATGRKRKYS